MKRFYSPRQHSFTLVELLVVLGIIAILAAVTMAAANKVLAMANRAKASVLANQIQTACLNYYVDYSLYPVVTSGTDTYYDDKTVGSVAANGWMNVTYALCGNQNPYAPSTTLQATTLNSRNIPYLNLNRSAVDTNGIPLNPLPPNTTEPYFFIAMDADYSGIIGDTGTKPINFSTSTAANIQSSALAAGVAVWANCNATTGITNMNWYVRTY